MKHLLQPIQIQIWIIRLQLQRTRLETILEFQPKKCRINAIVHFEIYAAYQTQAWQY